MLFLTSVTMSYGQRFFEEYQGLQEYQDYNSYQSTSDSISFGEEPGFDYGDVDFGNDGIGNPGDKVPVDDYVFILPIIGVLIGCYYFRKRSPTVVVK